MASERDNSIFRSYVETRLRLKSFTTSLGDDGEFFALSQASAEAYLSLSARLRNAKGQTAKTAFGYIDASSPNALADRFDDVAVIGLHVGLIASIFEFGQFIFTQPEFFPDIGSPYKEANPDPLLGYPPGFWSREAGGQITESKFAETIAHITPVCGERRNAALFTAHLMARFAWFHEHFHIVNGHVDWLATTKKGFGLTEFIEERGPDIARLPEVIRPMEFDADRSAFYALCKVQMIGTENIAGIATLPSTLRLRLSLFAAYSMTWLFDAYGRRSGGLGSTHPDPYLRLHNLMRTLASNIVPDMNEIVNINGIALTGFDALRTAIPDLPHGGRIIRDFSNADVQSALDDAGMALQALRAQWKPYQFHN